MGTHVIIKDFLKIKIKKLIKKKRCDEGTWERDYMKDPMSSPGSLKKGRQKDQLLVGDVRWKRSEQCDVRKESVYLC